MFIFCGFCILSKKSLPTTKLQIISFILLPDLTKLYSKFLVSILHAIVVIHLTSTNGIRHNTLLPLFCFSQLSCLVCKSKFLINMFLLPEEHFSISFSAVLLIMDSLYTCLSEKVFISPYRIIELGGWAGCSSLNWQFLFCFLIAFNWCHLIFFLLA